MPEAENVGKEARLRDVFKVYLIGVAIFIVSVIISNYTTGVIGIVAYFAIGIFLTKVYLPQIISFHPIYATINNLVGVKIRAILFWPISYLVLLTKLGFLHAMK